MVQQPSQEHSLSQTSTPGGAKLRQRAPGMGYTPQIALWPAASLFEKAGFHQLGCVGQEQFLPTLLPWRQQTDTTFVPFHPPRPEKSQMPSWWAGSWHCAAPTADFFSGQLPLVNIARVSQRMCGYRSPIEDCDYDCAFAHRCLKLHTELGHLLFLFGEELIWACYLWTATILPWKWEREKDVAWSLLWLENKSLDSGPVVPSPLSPAFSLQNSAQLRRQMWCFMLGDSFSKYALWNEDWLRKGVAENGWWVETGKWQGRDLGDVSQMLLKPVEL